MRSASDITKKIDAVMNKIGPPYRQLWKRVITRTGGDALIGRPTTVTNVDTVLTPQPIINRVGREAEVLTSTKQLLADDYRVLISPSAITETDLKSPDVMFLLKDGAGNIERLRVVDYEPFSLGGTAFLWQVILRSVSRA